MMLQLSPTIPVHVVSKNTDGYAMGWIDYSQEHDLMWIVGIDNREVWVVPNTDIRMQGNWTLRR